MSSFVDVTPKGTPDTGVTPLVNVTANTTLAGADGSPLLATDLVHSSDLIAYQRNGDIYTANADGSGETLIYSAGVSGQPSFSPDGTQIAFRNDRLGRR